MSLFDMMVSIERKTNNLVLPAYHQEEFAIAMNLEHRSKIRLILIQPLPGRSVAQDLAHMLYELHLFYLRSPHLRKGCACDGDCPCSDYRELWICLV